MNRDGIQVEGGFTLVEIVIVFAIASMALVGILAGNAGSQRYPQFTGDIDQLQIAAKGLQNAANATISTRPNGGVSPYVIFGKAMIFNSATPNTYTVVTLIQKDDPTTVTPASTLEACDAASSNLPDSITYSDSVSQAIVFRQTISTTASSPNQLYVASGGNISTAAGPDCASPGFALSQRTTRIAGAGLLAAIGNPLNWIAPPAYAASPCDIFDATSYAAGSCSNPTQLDFTNPADTHQIGTLNINPTTNTIMRSFNY